MINFPQPHILVIEDDEGVRQSLDLALRKLYQLHSFVSAEEAFDYLNDEGLADLISLDLILPGMNGIDALPKIKEMRPEAPIIVISAISDAPTGVKAIKLGAYDYIVKPFAGEELRQIVKHALENTFLKRQNALIRQETTARYHPDQLIGATDATLRCREQISQASQNPSDVLITGETGTGKELVARAIHHNSTYQNGPFIPVNCASLPRELAESELFGHEKGAFTGAIQRRIGAFEQANGGTIFLDEIAELDPSIQAKLLRVLEEKQICRVGGTRPINLNIRLISATNQDLDSAIENGRFRRDLYYRICVFHIHIPPLRDRIEDIPPIVEHWLVILQKKMGFINKPKVSQEYLEMLKQKPWPGNIRELKNILEAMLISVRKTQIKPLTIDQLPGQKHAKKQIKIQALKEATQDFEKELIEAALEKADGKTIEVCSLLKVTPRILRYKMKQLGIH